MKDLSQSVGENEFDQKLIKRQVTTTIGFWLGIAATILGVLSLLIAWIYDVCDYCGGSGCLECLYERVNTRGMPTTSPLLWMFVLAGGIVVLFVVSHLKKKYNLPPTAEGSGAWIIPVGFIVGFIEIFVSTNSFKFAYDGFWSFVVGNMDYISALLAVIYWIGVLIIPVGMMVSEVRGSQYSIARAKYEAAEKTREEKNIAELYRQVFSAIDCPKSEQVRRLENYVADAARNAIENYHRQNNITTTENSYSDLGLCGTSNTHFHYCLDEISDYHSYTSAAAVKTKGYPLKAKKIPLNCIKCYKIEGSLQYTSNVQGGGVNLQGAAIGALIGGDAAAIIGSRVGTETRTDIVAHDNRKLTIFYEEDNSVKSLQVNSYEFDKTIAVLRKLIPQKEEAMAILESSKPNAASNTLAVDALKELKELLDSGIITQEEFEAKKKQLLGL